MDNKEQARKRRKKRLLMKRIRATLLLLLCLAVVFFAVKGLISLISGKNTPSTPSSGSHTVSQTVSDVSSEINEASQPAQQAGTTSDFTQAPSQAVSDKPDKNEFTTLVNTEHPLTADFDVTTRKVANTEKLFDVRAADSLEAMLSDAAKQGYPMYLVSTYRTIKYQEGLYNRKVNSYLSMGYSQQAAQEEAAKWVAVPGTSEHNLGLSADIVSSTWYNTNSDLTQEFENTAHYTWLIENCAKYGFIIRYPKGKESVTGIQYEPWHYRYVGVEVAEYIMEKNLTLEEFWQD